jgi:hypothetical protein
MFAPEALHFKYAKLLPNVRWRGRVVRAFPFVPFSPPILNKWFMIQNMHIQQTF